MESSISAFHLISVIAAFLSISLGTFLLFIKSKQNRANRYLGLLLLIYALFFIPILFDVLGILDEFPHVIRLNFFSGTLVGPLTFLYCKASIQKDYLSLKKYYYHFIPFLLSIPVFVPTLIKTGEEKLAIYNKVITTGQAPGSNLIIIIMAIFTISYTVFSINMVSQYLKHVKNSSSSIDPSFHRWLLFLSISLLFPIIAVLIITISSAKVILIVTAAFTIASFIFIVYITLTLKPKFFHFIPYQIENLESQKEEKEKYQNSNLQDNQKDKFQEKLLVNMKSQKPYLNPELNISQLSEQLKIPTYYLSQLINERLGCNFLDFVNRYRIEELKDKLMDESLNHYTIITLAYESGFNSKTAFYSAFKKNVGSTPSQFRKENQSVRA